MHSMHFAEKLLQFKISTDFYTQSSKYSFKMQIWCRKSTGARGQEKDSLDFILHECTLRH